VPKRKRQMTVYTDGGASPNPGPGGWAAVLLHPSGRVQELSGGEANTTNNRMELTAAIRALEALPEGSSLEVFTDSRYLQLGITRWLPSWIARGWQRKDGEVKNLDLWRRLADLAAKRTVRWAWVKGHAGRRYNERADSLARAEIERRSGGGRKSGAAPVQAEVFLRVSCARGRGAWAALVRHNDEEEILCDTRQGVTANQLDILAAQQALERVAVGSTVAVYTGSDYLRNGASQWIHGWQRRNWRNRAGEPVKNVDLWKRLAATMNARRVRWPSSRNKGLPEFKALETTLKGAWQETSA
jgi:ribonuclease HI